MAVRATEGGYTFRIDATASGYAFSGFQRLPETQEAAYIAWLSGSTIRVMNTNTGVIEWSGTNIVSGLMYGATASNGKGPYLIRGGQYNVEAWLPWHDLTLDVRGETWTGLAGGDIVATYPNTVLRKKYSGTSGFIDLRNDAYSKQTFSKLYILGGNSGDAHLDTGIGIDTYDTRERTLFDRVMVAHFDIGVKMSWSVYASSYDLVVNSCPNIGLYLTSEANATYVNTTRFFGGAILNCATGIRAERAGDVQFFGTVVEAHSSGAIVSASGSDYMSFYSCSLEVNGSGITNIHEYGNNNLYEGCRFAGSGYKTMLATYPPASSIKFIGNYAQAVTPNDEYNITLNSGTTGPISIIGTTRGTNTATTLSLTDNTVSGTHVVIIGNATIQDQFKGLGVSVGHSGTRLFELGSFLEMRDNAGTARRNLSMAACMATSLRSVSQIDIINVSGGGSSWVQPEINEQLHTYRASGMINVAMQVASGATAGSGTTLPGTPEGYWIIQVSGVNRKVPFYRT